MAEIPLTSPRSTRLILSAVGDAIACYDSGGMRVWSNPAFDTLLRERHDFVVTDRRLGMAACELAVQKGASAAAVTSEYCRTGEFAAPTMDFAARAVFIPGTRAGERDTVMVILTSRPLEQQLAAWRTRYRLTQRELEVTALLLQGCSNAEVAEGLGISAHTARHHTERVLDKLGVQSRAAVGALLRGERARGDSPA